MVKLSTPKTEAAKPEVKPKGNPVINGETQKKRALELASKASQGLVAALDHVDDIKVEARVSTWTILSMLQDEYDLSEFPIPGSEGGNNPDKIKIDDYNAKGERVKVSTTFYAQFSRGLPKSVSLANRINDLKRLSNATDNLEGISKELIAQFKGDDKKRLRDDEISLLESRIDGHTASIRKAVAIHVQFERIETELTDVVATVQTYPDGSVFKGKDPIYLYHVQRWVENAEGEKEGIPHPSLYKTMGIASFLKMNVDKAKENGGGYEALIETLKREGDRGGGNASGAKPDKIATNEKLFVRLDDCYGYMQEVWKDKSGSYAALLKELNAAGSDDKVVTLFELFNMLKDITSIPKLQHRYEATLTGEEKAA